MALSKLCNKLDPEIGRRLQFRYTELPGGRKGRNSYMYMMSELRVCGTWFLHKAVNKEESWYQDNLVGLCLYQS